MQDGDFIRINYIGKFKESGQTFDSGENIPIIVGAGYVFKGLDNKLKELNVGDKKTIEISPEEGFGNRNPDLIKTLPESEFRKQGTRPYPGMLISADNLRGRVVSVTSGRVKVDFNHPLAGKTLLYEIEIKEKIEKTEDKVKAVVEFYMKDAKPEIKIREKTVEIITKPLVNVNVLVKKKIADDIIKYIGMDKVVFSEVFEKK